MNYEVPIPSYKRIDMLMKATLPMLERHDCDPKRVTIFVANSEEYAAYRSAVPEKYKIVQAELGLLQVKRFYHNHYDAGTPLFNVQDDIYDLKQKKGDKLEP